MASQELVLLYNFQNTQRGRRIKTILIQMGIRIKNVDPKDYLEPIGYLCGVKGAASSGSPYEGEGFREEMLVMKGMSGARIDAFLNAMRRSKIEKVHLKAVLTDTNQNWNSIELHRELQQEHDSVEGKF